MKNIIDINSDDYPRLLKEIKDPPDKIYYKGNWDSRIFENCLTVAGSRKMTVYGRNITDRLISEITAYGITIVSGFMYGIDATAHKTALDNNGRTIAVMPCGIDLIHPAYQEKLYKEILENDGLIISEYEGTFPPALWTYPRRNRIMTGLSAVTMIVEAGAKSGSLITARLAKEYNRKLFAVPGPLTSTLSYGTAQLIKQGANIVTEAKDILECYGFENRGCPKPSERTAPVFKLNKLEQLIMEKLNQEPMRIDNLSRVVKVSVSEVGTILSLMQLKGLLFEEDGKYYVN